MSGDPIEVLRALRDEWARVEGVGPAIDASIASLSAPKPESAEAVFNCPTCPVSVQSRWQEPECPECGERCYLDPTAVPVPPRPEASAPVGVEGRARETVALALDEAGHPTEANNVRRGIDLDEYRVELSAARIALAQQPAAVDGAMVARFLDAFRNTAGDEAIDADEKVARRWLTAALAGGSKS